MKGKGLLIVIIIVCGLTASSGSWAQKNPSSGASNSGSPEAVRSITVITLHGKIVAVNKADKLVTLEGPNGRKVTLKVENPYNLNAAKVGAPVVTRFYEVVTVRKKRAGENIPNVSLKGGVATATKGEVPGAAAEAKASVVLSVTAIDETKGLVTVKAADGTVETARVRNANNLKGLKVGDELVVTLERAIAVSLEKESEGSAS